MYTISFSWHCPTSSVNQFHYPPQYNPNYSGVRVYVCVCVISFPFVPFKNLIKKSKWIWEPLLGIKFLHQSLEFLSVVYRI